MSVEGSPKTATYKSIVLHVSTLSQTIRID